MHGCEPAYDGVIPHVDVATQCSVIGENDIVSDGAIVPDMAVREKISTVADSRFAFACRTAVCRYEFAERVFVADFQISRFAAIF